MEELTVDPRFRDALPNLTREEFKTLEDNIVADGAIKEPIVVWGDTGIILDGHHRYKIAKKHSFEFKLEKLDFASTDEAIKWIIDHQMGKRNLSGTQLSMVRSKRASLMDHQGKAAAILGVSDRQLRTDRKVTEVIESLPEDKQEVAKRASQADILTLGNLPPEQKEEVVSRLGDKTLAQALPKPKHKLSAEHMALVKEHFDTNTLQRVIAGAEITPAQVEYICSCPAVRRRLILDTVSANDCSFAEAIDLSKRSPKKPTSLSLDITKQSEKVEDLAAKLVTAMDLYAEMVGILKHGEYEMIRASVERVSPALAKVNVNKEPDAVVARQKAMKTAQALIRCVDDIHHEKPDAKRHHDLLTKSKEILEGVQEW